MSVKCNEIQLNKATVDKKLLFACYPEPCSYDPCLILISLTEICIYVKMASLALAYFCMFWLLFI